jgi:hypothetical protein
MKRRYEDLTPEGQAYLREFEAWVDQVTDPNRVFAVLILGCWAVDRVLPWWLALVVVVGALGAAISWGTLRWVRDNPPPPSYRDTR